MIGDTGTKAPDSKSKLPPSSTEPGSLGVRPRVVGYEGWAKPVTASICLASSSQCTPGWAIAVAKAKCSDTPPTVSLCGGIGSEL